MSIAPRGAHCSSCFFVFSLIVCCLLLFALSFSVDKAKLHSWMSEYGIKIITVSMPPGIMQVPLLLDLVKLSLGILCDERAYKSDGRLRECLTMKSSDEATLGAMALMFVLCCVFLFSDWCW